jgi:exopolyphosphatase/guanosine-5'-triphosphate,3'-diphosphate pyrophosphatase
MEGASAIVIDLGTNTFHMLVGQLEPGGTIRPLYRQRYYVRLARGGFHHIADEAIQDAMKACEHFKQTMALWPMLPKHVLGTAAFRLADNGAELQQLLEPKSCIRKRVKGII